MISLSDIRHERKKLNTLKIKNMKKENKIVLGRLNPSLTSCLHIDLTDRIIIYKALLAYKEDLEEDHYYQETIKELINDLRLVNLEDYFQLRTIKMEELEEWAADGLEIDGDSFEQVERSHVNRSVDLPF